MSFYKNTKCPVCGKEFKDDDDIVTCPECGTPHHRECYEKLGRCANEELHKDGYDYYESHKSNSNNPQDKSKHKQNSAYYDPNNSAVNKDLANSNTSNNESEQKAQGPFTPTPTTVYTTYDNDKELIDGQAVSDVALAVGVNAQSFIPKFKQLSRGEKKFKWNWSAFFFGPFYMMFRKMYKLGTAFFTANIVTILVSAASCFKFAPQSADLYMKALTGQLTTEATTLAEQTMALQEALPNMPDVNTFVMILNIATIVLFAIKIIAGIITNKAYKNQIVKNIIKIDTDIKNGVKAQNVFMYGVGQMPTDDDLRKLLLVKKGSVSFFAPILAYFAIEILTTIITALL